MNKKNTEAIEIAESLINKLVSNSLPSLDSGLKLYYRLVSIIKNEEEMDWAKMELSGYGNIKNIPKYRWTYFKRDNKYALIHHSCRELIFDLDNNRRYSYPLYIKSAQNEFKKSQNSHYNSTYVNPDRLARVVYFVSDRIFERTNHILNDLKQDLILEEENTQETALDKLLNVLSKFPAVSRQLLVRYDKREPLAIKDEYDVQDLLHALLKIFFDDIRPEEWTPSYAGGASRMDFLLKNEQVVIEVKKTRDRLEDKKVGEQLLVDIAKYSTHQDCKTLVCFVYDPDKKIKNPIGLENDLNKQSTDELRIITIIEPKN